MPKGAGPRPKKRGNPSRPAATTVIRIKGVSGHAGNASVYLFAAWHGTAGGNKKRNAPDGRKYGTVYIVRSLSHDTG